MCCGGVIGHRVVLFSIISGEGSPEPPHGASFIYFSISGEGSPEPPQTARNALRLCHGPLRGVVVPGGAGPATYILGEGPQTPRGGQSPQVTPDVIGGY